MELLLSRPYSSGDKKLKISEIILKYKKIR